MKRLFPDPFRRPPLAPTSGVGIPVAGHAEEEKKEGGYARAREASVQSQCSRRGPDLGDNVDGDDLVIRRAAVAALGTFAGSVVVVDPSNGRVLRW